MYDYLEIYTDISLTLTMIITILVYSVGLMQFLRPFTKSRPARYLTGLTYAAIMLTISDVLIYICTFLTVLSGIIYLYDYRAVFKGTEH